VFVFSNAFAFCAEYPILLSRPYEKGNIITKNAVMQTSTKFVILDNNKTQIQSQSNKFSVNYNGIETVLKVDGHGNVLELKAEINKLLLKSSKGEHPLISKGQILSAKTDNDKTIYKVGDIELAANIKQYVSDIISTYHSNEINPDEIYGTSIQKRVGDKWDINSTLMKKEIESGIFNVSKVKGTVELAKVEKINNIECLLLVTNIQANIDYYKTNKTKVNNGYFKMQMFSYYPVDLRKHIIKETVSLFTHIECPTPQKEGWITKIEIKQDMETTITPSATKDTSGLSEDGSGKKK
jgi:hypothetical protein